MRSPLPLAATLALAACSKEATPATAITVAAAADLSLALPKVGEAFRKKTGQPVTFSFGASGMLAKQIAEGAPFDLFAAANVELVDNVIRSGACDGTTKASYARGRVVLAWRAGAPAPTSLAELALARWKRIAIAKPETAPYGRAAVEALRAAGIYDQVKDRLIIGENVRHALQIVESGNADLALTSLALVGTNATLGHLVIDERLHQPIEQALVVCQKGPRTSGGRAFAEYLRSDEAKQILSGFGFQ